VKIDPVLLAKATKAIENYVFKNDKKYALEIKKNVKGIPDNFRKGGTFFRGMVLDAGTVVSIQNGKPLELSAPSSWTDNQKLAERFVTDAKKRTATKDGVGVVFKKRIPDPKVIVNVYSFVLFFDNMGMLGDFDELTKQDALDEFEILCDKGIKLTDTDILKVIQK